jgi:hypothetical protein
VATLLLAEHTPSGTDRAPGTVQHLTSPSLRDWLHEGWAILFSHPDDFVSYDLEMDRWLVITRRAFAECRIRPIALASPALDPDHSWITQVSGDNRAVLLEDPSQHHFGPVDLQTPVLREAIEQTGRRFVMIIDSALRIQKTFTYQELSKLPSPLELLGWADALQTRRGSTLRASETNTRTSETNSWSSETNSRAAPARHVHPFFAARRHKHRVPQVACAAGMDARAG